MTKFLARVRVLLTAAPTWLTVAAVIVASVSEEIAAAFPGAAEPVARWTAPVLAAIAAATAIVRRVTPVLPDQRGLLPAESSAPTGHAEEIELRQSVARDHLSRAPR